jgi:hypothetical protein
MDSSNALASRERKKEFTGPVVAEPTALVKDNNNNTKSKIKLGKTFFNIASGTVSASEVAARKKAEKEAARAETLRKGQVPDRTDPFIANFGR